MKKKTSLSAKLIAAFMAAILGSVLICALLTHSKVESVLNSNMQLTSEQTLNSAMTSLQTYEKTISIPVDLLTRKDSIKQLLLEPENYDKYIDNVNDELVAACKVVNGSVRAYYALNDGRTITGWVQYEADGSKTAMNTVENKDLSGKEWYTACQGRKAKVNSIFSYITQPYEDPQTGGQIFTVAQEVKYKDVLMGVVAMDIDAAQLENYIRNIRILNTGFAMLIDADGNIVIDSDKNTFADGNVTGLEFWTPISGELKSLEEQKSALNDAIETENVRVSLCEDKHSIQAYFDKFLHADVNDPEIRDQVFEYFVDKVYLYDDKLVVSMWFSEDDKQEITWRDWFSLDEYWTDESPFVKGGGVEFDCFPLSSTKELI